MTKHKTPNLLLFLFAVAALIALLLSPNASLQAAPVFQSGLPTPTNTPTATSTPTPTPIPPDLSQSYKTVSQSAAIVGDVLTYTVVMVNTGGPGEVVTIDFLKPEMGYVSRLTYTGGDDLFYNPSAHAWVWSAQTLTGTDRATITWQVTITGLPVGGVLTNSAGIWANQTLYVREAVTLIQTPTATPSPTPIPLPTATPSPTQTPRPTVTPSATPRSHHPVVPPPGPATTPTVGWRPPVTWPEFLPETGDEPISPTNPHTSLTEDHAQ